MKIIVNGDVRSISAASLADVLEELGFDGAVVATALNEEFVPSASREETQLSDGDRLEVLAPMQGG
jgi:sulfur carrier protein